MRVALFLNITVPRICRESYAPSDNRTTGPGSFRDRRDHDASILINAYVAVRSGDCRRFALFNNARPVDLPPDRQGVARIDRYRLETVHLGQIDLASAWFDRFKL